MAGNDDNDVSMVQLCEKGAYFICLNNASAKLKQVSTALRKFTNSLFMAKNEGTNGILEGLLGIIGK